MSEAADHQRTERQDAARVAAYEAAGERREERRHGPPLRAYRPRWRYYDAVQAARELGGSDPA